jgi:hypothetical protein
VQLTISSVKSCLVEADWILPFTVRDTSIIKYIVWFQTIYFVNYKLCCFLCQRRDGVVGI